MTTYQTQTPIIVGIFQDEMPAKNAVDTLRNKGFAQEQIGVAMHGGAPVEHLAQDFMQLGVATEPAHYYEKEFDDGHIVVSVRHDGRLGEAEQILRSNGGYDYQPTGQAQTMTQQPQNMQARESKPLAGAHNQNAWTTEQGRGNTWQANMQSSNVQQPGTEASQPDLRKGEPWEDANLTEEQKNARRASQLTEEQKEARRSSNRSVLEEDDNNLSSPPPYMQQPGTDQNQRNY